MASQNKASLSWKALRLASRTDLNAFPKARNGDLPDLVSAIEARRSEQADTNAAAPENEESAGMDNIVADGETPGLEEAAEAEGEAATADAIKAEAPSEAMNVEPEKADLPTEMIAGEALETSDSAVAETESMNVEPKVEETKVDNSEAVMQEGGV